MAQQEKVMQKPAVVKEPKADKYHALDKSDEVLVRISGYDIIGSKGVYVGLTKIKGVSWSISNATCLKLKIPRMKKISELTKDEIKKIEEFLDEPDIGDFMKNRRNDYEGGETHHFVGSDVDIKKDFDIRRLKKVRAYRGLRHIAGLPSRGQRTRSHFRKKGQAVRVRKK